MAASLVAEATTRIKAPTQLTPVTSWAPRFGHFGSYKSDGGLLDFMSGISPPWGVVVRSWRSCGQKARVTVDGATVDVTALRWARVLLVLSFIGGTCICSGYGERMSGYIPLTLDGVPPRRRPREPYSRTPLLPYSFMMQKSRGDAPAFYFLFDFFSGGGAGALCCSMCA